MQHCPVKGVKQVDEPEYQDDRRTACDKRRFHDLEILPAVRVDYLIFHRG